MSEYHENDPGTEAEALYDMHAGSDADLRAHGANIPRDSDRPVDRMKSQYELNKKAKVGSIILCPFCFNKVNKTSYQKQFCNSRHKDQYWNTVDAKRKARAHMMNGTIPPEEWDEDDVDDI